MQGATGVLEPAYALTVTVQHVDDATCTPSSEAGEGLILGFVTPESASERVRAAVLSNATQVGEWFLSPSMIDGIDVARSADRFVLSQATSSADAGGPSGSSASVSLILGGDAAFFTFESASLRGIDADHDGRFERLVGEMTGALDVPVPGSIGCGTRATFSVVGVP